MDWWLLHLHFHKDHVCKQTKGPKGRWESAMNTSCSITSPFTENGWPLQFMDIRYMNLGDIFSSIILLNILTSIIWKHCLKHCSPQLCGISLLFVLCLKTTTHKLFVFFFPTHVIAVFSWQQYLKKITELKCNSHIMKITFLKCTIQWFFRVFTKLYVTEYFKPLLQ